MSKSSDENLDEGKIADSAGGDVDRRVLESIVKRIEATTRKEDASETTRTVALAKSRFHARR